MNAPRLAIVWLHEGDDIAAARAIEAGLYAAHLLALGRSDPGLPDVVAAGRRSAELLWAVGLRVARKQANRLARAAALPVDDLFQEACLAVAHSIRSYDHTRGVRFTTFTFHVIAAHLSDAGHLRVGSGSSRADRRAARRVAWQRERDPSVGLDEAAALASATVGSVLRGSIRQVPLDAAVDLAVTDSTRFDAEPSLDFLDLLSPRLRAVLAARLARPSATLTDLAAAFGVSTATMFRREREALDAARQVLTAERTVHPALSRDRPPATASGASPAPSARRTGPGARSRP